MSNERLTRHEISWLLAQEARGAAKALRSELRPPGAGDPRPVAAPVETTLDVLDDAIDMLSALNTGARGKGRRGRIDLAALLYDVAPNARISIEPGAGTEVFGDEADLRRMLNLLVSQANASSGSAPIAETEVTIRRQGDSVRISVDLGPDTSATGELERRWLSRMAVRHGGWVELEGGTQSIYLQADGASDQREVTELRKELEQAQQLGEAYARELATVVASGDVKTEPPPQRIGNDQEHLVIVQSASAATHRVLKGLFDALRSDAAEVAGLPNAADVAQRLSSRMLAAHELLAEYAAIAECPADEGVETVEVGTMLREALSRIETRLSREGVESTLSAADGLRITSKPRLLALLFDSALAHALAATPKGGSLGINAFASELGVIVTVADGGPAIPEALRAGVLSHRVDPTSLGRPSGISLIAAGAAAAALGAALELRDGIEGHPELWLTLRKRASIPVSSGREKA